MRERTASSFACRAAVSAADRAAPDGRAARDEDMLRPSTLPERMLCSCAASAAFRASFVAAASAADPLRCPG